MNIETGRPDHIDDVLTRLHPGQWFTFFSPITGKDRQHSYRNLVVLDSQYEKPTRAFLDSELVAMQAAWDKKHAPYRLARKAEYPSVEDQLDMMYHDQKEGTTVWLDTVEAVKTKYPKPSN